MHLNFGAVGVVKAIREAARGSRAIPPGERHLKTPKESTLPGMNAEVWGVLLLLRSRNGGTLRERNLLIERIVLLRGGLIPQLRKIE